MHIVPAVAPADESTVAVKASLTVKPPKTVVENREFQGFCRRIIRAFSRRVAAGDVEALRDLVALSRDLDAAITDAVVGLREFGYSWTEIGERLNISKQAAQQRWGAAS